MKTNFFDIALALRLGAARIFRASLFKKAVSLAPTRDEYGDATPNRP